jgi:hypothetical protein
MGPVFLYLCWSFSELASSIYHTQCCSALLSQLALLAAAAASSPFACHCSAMRAIENASGSLPDMFEYVGRPMEVIGRQTPKELKQI